MTDSCRSKVLVVLDYASQPTSLFILGLSVSLLTTSLRPKSFVGIGLGLILVLSFQEFLLLLHLIGLPLLSCLLAPLRGNLIPVSHHLVGRWILMLVRLGVQRSGFQIGHLEFLEFGVLGLVLVHSSNRESQAVLGKAS